MRRGRSAESVGRHKDGSTFPMELDLSDVATGTGTIHIACLRDISERRSYTETLQHQALHDNLTGLPNRVLFGDRVDACAPGRDQERASRCALMVMDLDEFKQVNDTLGHQHGDALLKLVTERLVGCLRDGDTVARLGGDEFGILPRRQASTWPAPRRSSGRSSRRSSRRSSSTATPSRCTASIGITLAPGDGDNVDDLLRRADLAMYDAKRTGSGYALFAAEQEEAPARRLALLGDLRRCIERDELVLHLPAEDRPRHDGDRRRRGPDPLEPPVGARVHAGRVHARGRAQRADDPADRVGDQRGLAPAADLARRRLST